MPRTLVPGDGGRPLTESAPRPKTARSIAPTFNAKTAHRLVLCYGRSGPLTHSLKTLTSAHRTDVWNVPSTYLPRVQTLGPQRRKSGVLARRRPSARPVKFLTYGTVRGVITCPLRVGIRTRLAHEVIEMRRRDLVIFIGGAMAWMSAARAQEARRVIGVLGAFIGSSTFPGALPAFFQGLRETGFVEGKNLGVEFRWADGHYDRLPSLAAELVGRNVGVIYAHDVPSALAAKVATKTIPIVFSTGTDPVKVGLVASFGRPTGNLTGASFLMSSPPA
jgi:hypothetical protein